MAVFEVAPSDLTTGLTIPVGGSGYRSGDGDGPGWGSLTSEDFLRVSDNSDMGYKVYEIDVTGNDVSIIVCSEFENGTTLRPWEAGVSMNADAAGAVTLLADTDSDYSYTVTNAGLAAALAADVTALVFISLV